jgi:hypothetical protein
MTAFEVVRRYRNGEIAQLRFESRQVAHFFWTQFREQARKRMAMLSWDRDDDPENPDRVF